MEEAGRSDATPVALLNGEQLESLLVENGIGQIDVSPREAPRQAEGL